VAKNLRLRLETYYQYLFDIPRRCFPKLVQHREYGLGFQPVFPRYKLVQRRHGPELSALEATMERFFSQGYYLLFTGSVFDSKYAGSDGVLRNTTFNGRFAFNLVAGAGIHLQKRLGAQPGRQTHLPWAGAGTGRWTNKHRRMLWRSST
jgi:hypothetical protein